MREVVLTIPRLAVEDILDRLLPIVPGGVREHPAGRHLELRMRGPEVPELAEIERAVGRWPHRLAEHEVADDWRERRLAGTRRTRSAAAPGCGPTGPLSRGRRRATSCSRPAR